MKKLAKILYILPIALACASLTSCDNKEEILSVDGYQLETPFIWIYDVTNSSAMVELNVAEYIDETLYLIYFPEGSTSYNSRIVLEPVNAGIEDSGYRFIYSLEGLNKSTNYELHFSLHDWKYSDDLDKIPYKYGDITVVAEFKFPNKENIFSINKLLNAVASSPIAIDGGFDDGWRIYDGNNDGITWESVADSDSRNYGGYGYAARMGYNMSKDNDDMLLSPEYYLERGKSYVISYALKTSSLGGTQTLLVFAVDADNMANDDALTSLDYFSGRSTSYSVRECIFKPTASGYYNIAFYDISDKNQYYTYLTGFEIIEQSEQKSVKPQRK